MRHRKCATKKKQDKIQASEVRKEKISRTGKSYSYSHTMHQFKQKLHCQLSEGERTIPPYFSPFLHDWDRNTKQSLPQLLCVNGFELLCSSERTGRKEMKEGLQDLYLLRATNLSAAYRHTHTRTHTPSQTSFSSCRGGAEVNSEGQNAFRGHYQPSQRNKTHRPEAKWGGYVCERGKRWREERFTHVLCKGVHLP